MPITKKEFIRLLANRMETNEEEASKWLEATLDSLYETFKQGEGVTLTGFGGFYVKKRGHTWAFKFNPGQKLRALFGWASTYKGEK